MKGKSNETNTADLYNLVRPPLLDEIQFFYLPKLNFNVMKGIVVAYVFFT